MRLIVNINFRFQFFSSEAMDIRTENSIHYSFALWHCPIACANEARIDPHETWNSSIDTLGYFYSICVLAHNNILEV
jgi:hypothetical protein